MTPLQLRMAIAAANIQLREVAAATGLHASTLSKIANGKADATTTTMSKLRRYFSKDHGLRFSAEHGWLCVCAPDIDEPR